MNTTPSKPLSGELEQLCAALEQRCQNVESSLQSALDLLRQVLQAQTSTTKRLTASEREIVPPTGHAQQPQNGPTTSGAETAAESSAQRLTKLEREFALLKKQIPQSQGSQKVPLTEETGKSLLNNLNALQHYLPRALAVLEEQSRRQRKP